MRRTATLIYIILLVAVLPCRADRRGTALRFEQTSIDFGTVAEEGGPVEHIFRFRNLSAEPVVVLGATTSCGCTRAEHSREPVAAGGEGQIVARLSPMHYPGAFDRKIMIHTSEGDYTLRIYGRVTPRPLTFEERYPIALGKGVCMSRATHAFGYIEHGKPQYDTLWIANRSAREVQLRLIPTATSDALQLTAPQRVAAGDSVAIRIGYALPERCNIYGTLKDVVSVEIDGERSKRSILAHGIAIDSRDEFADTEEPKIELSENFIKFGRLKYGKSAPSARVKVCNTGVSALEIRCIELEEAFFTARIEGNRRLRRGRTCEIVVTPSTNTYGAVIGRVKIISNDPQHPMRSIKVSAIIEE